MAGFGEIARGRKGQLDFRNPERARMEMLRTTELPSIPPSAYDRSFLLEVGARSDGGKLAEVWHTPPLWRRTPILNGEPPSEKDPSAPHRAEIITFPTRLSGKGGSGGDGPIDPRLHGVIIIMEARLWPTAIEVIDRLLRNPSTTAITAELLALKGECDLHLSLDYLKEAKEKPMDRVALYDMAERHATAAIGTIPDTSDPALRAIARIVGSEVASHQLHEEEAALLLAPLYPITGDFLVALNTLANTFDLPRNIPNILEQGALTLIQAAISADKYEWAKNALHYIHDQALTSYQNAVTSFIIAARKKIDTLIRTYEQEEQAHVSDPDNVARPEFYQLLIAFLNAGTAIYSLGAIREEEATSDQRGFFHWGYNTTLHLATLFARQPAGIITIGEHGYRKTIRAIGTRTGQSWPEDTNALLTWLHTFFTDQLIGWFNRAFSKSDPFNSTTSAWDETLAAIKRMGHPLDIRLFLETHHARLGAQLTTYSQTLRREPDQRPVTMALQTLNQLDALMRDNSEIEHLSDQTANLRAATYLSIFEALVITAGAWTLEYFNTFISTATTERASAPDEHRPRFDFYIAQAHLRHAFYRDHQIWNNQSTGETNQQLLRDHYPIVLENLSQAFAADPRAATTDQAFDIFKAIAHAVETGIESQDPSLIYRASAILNQMTETATRGDVATLLRNDMKEDDASTLSDELRLAADQFKRTVEKLMPDHGSLHLNPDVIILRPRRKK